MKAHLRLKNDYEKHGFFQLSELCDTLNTMKKFAEPYQPSWRVIATQSLRSIKNRDHIVAKVKSRTGLDIEILDGYEEARLSYLGMRYSLTESVDRHLFFDIGGRSTEIIDADTKQVFKISSIGVGALQLSERFFSLETPSEIQISELKAYLQTRLKPLTRDFVGSKVAIATAGTLKNLAKIHFKLVHQTTLDQVDGYQLRLEDIREISKELIRLADPLKIREAFCLENRRADIILAGCLLVESISEQLQISSWQVSSFGLREGLALDSYERELLPSESLCLSREQSLKEFAKKYACDEVYAKKLELVACQVLDQLLRVRSTPKKKQHTLRELVKAASWIYETGKYVNFSSYHRHSYYLITEGQLFGFSQQERHLIACAILFSRKKPLGEKKKNEFKYLSQHYQEVQSLAFALRVARCVNRYPDSKVECQLNGFLNGLKLSIAAERKNLEIIRTHMSLKEEKHLNRSLPEPIIVEWQAKES